MSLVPQEKLDAEYWAHRCESKDDAVVYTPNRTRCYLCNKTKTEAGSRVIEPSANTAG